MRILTLAVALAAAPGPAAAQDDVVVPAAPGGVALTVHGGDIALVRDRRPVELRQGSNHLVFDQISRAIIPESVTLRAAGTGLRLVERSYDRDTLTPQSLLARAVGGPVAVRRINPATGADEERRGRLLAVDGPALVEIDGRIEAVDPAAIVLDRVPPGLRNEPALVVVVEVDQAGRRELELGYLTQGLSWRADYVLELAADAARINLDAVATVTNDSGTAFRGARLAFAAGDVNRVPLSAPPRPVPMREKAMSAMAPMAADAEPERQAMAAAHLYRVERPTDLADHQIKQVSLFSRQAVPVQREYAAPPQAQAFHYRLPEPQESNASLTLVVHNTTAAGLGAPLPGGVVRIYQRDAQGELRFQGEDRIGHTPEGGEVRLEVGRDFDLPLKRLQTAFQRLSTDVTESSYEIWLRNAKAEAVTVRVKDIFGGDWQIVEESVPHSRETAQTAVWPVAVPAKGEAVLRYKVRVRGY